MEDATFIYIYVYIYMHFFFQIFKWSVSIKGIPSIGKTITKKTKSNKNRRNKKQPHRQKSISIFQFWKERNIQTKKIKWVLFTEEMKKKEMSFSPFSSVSSTSLRIYIHVCIYIYISIYIYPLHIEYNKYNTCVHIC